MHVRRSFNIWLLVFVICALPLGVVGIQVDAQDEPTPPPHRLPPHQIELTLGSAVLGAVSVDGDVQTLAFQPNPYGCEGQTDQPHNSTHQYGTINVVARTECDVTVPEIYVDTILERLVNNTWVHVGPFAPVIDFKKYLVTTNSAASCTPGYYRGLSYHYIVGADGNIYDALTYNAAQLDCPS